MSFFVDPRESKRTAERSEVKNLPVAGFLVRGRFPYRSPNGNYVGDNALGILLLAKRKTFRGIEVAAPCGFYLNTFFRFSAMAVIASASALFTFRS